MFNCCFAWFVCLITGCVGCAGLGAVLRLRWVLVVVYFAGFGWFCLWFAMAVGFVSLIIGRVCFSVSLGFSCGWVESVCAVLSCYANWFC